MSIKIPAVPISIASLLDRQYRERGDERCAHAKRIPQPPLSKIKEKVKFYSRKKWPKFLKIAILFLIIILTLTYENSPYRRRRRIVR